MSEARNHLHPDDCQPVRQAVARGEVRMAARVRGQYPGTPDRHATADSHFGTKP